MEKDNVSVTDCKPYLESPSLTWIDVQGEATSEVLTPLGQLLGLHPLALEDVQDTGQRPKLDLQAHYVFVVMSLAAMRNRELVIDQISVFVGEGYLVSFHNGSTDPFEPVRKRLRIPNGRVRSRKLDYLLYALIDVTIDAAFPVLEGYGERVEDLEQELLEAPGPATLNHIHDIKRELLILRRMLWPQREVLNGLLRDDEAIVETDTKPYLRDCYDHTIQIMDLIETYRDMTAGMVDVYLSSVSNRLNESMRILTVIATIFIPLTFIVGVYGMNFGTDTHSPWAMPELDWYYAYPVLWLVMIGLAVGMLVVFKLKKWL